jgi:hypothetical protein
MVSNNQNTSVMEDYILDVECQKIVGTRIMGAEMYCCKKTVLQALNAHVAYKGHINLYM